MSRITQMPAASPLSGTELIEVVQGGINKSVPVSSLYSMGPEGLSAYEAAVANGFVGTESEWLEFLRGKSAYEIAQQFGYSGTEAEWVLSLQGTNGKSAYEQAQDAGFVGTLLEWLDSLVGADGSNGTFWHVLGSDPTAVTGNVGDFAYNNVSKEYFYKANVTTWISQGVLGGLADAPSDGGAYLRKMGQWERLNRYDLAVVATTTQLDLAVSQIFKVDATADRTLTFANVPGSDRGMVVVVHMVGSGGVITWPAGINWNKGVTPVLGSGFTIVSLLWTGTDWFGSVSSST